MIEPVAAMVPPIRLGFGIYYISRMHTLESPTGFFARTHGLTHIGHPEIEIVHPMPGAERILEAAVHRILNGATIRPGQCHDFILKGGYQPLAVAMPTGRVRLIMPDPENQTALETISVDFAMQHVPSGRVEELH